MNTLHAAYTRARTIAVLLASAASDYVHGALIPVDGGWLGR
jgi:NAD(P)-dependent dehydrogenase (short-subunit alcohol dehydrogenase family)